MDLPGEARGIAVHGRAIRAAVLALAVAAGSAPSSARCWKVVQLGPAVGPASIEEVAGHPALAYMESASTMKFVRATDPAGATWGAPVTVMTGAASLPILMVAGGNPAIAFDSGGSMSFVRATDALGTTWGPPVPVGPGNLGDAASVAGAPAVTFTTGSPPDIFFQRALDPEGTSWAPPVDAPRTGLEEVDPSLVDAGGVPAIGYTMLDRANSDTRGCFYITVANDAAGTTWPPWGTEILCIDYWWGVSWPYVDYLPGGVVGTFIESPGNSSWPMLGY